MLIKLYKCFVRPVLEYASVVFSPHHISLIDLIENVQRRFTKRLYGTHSVCYVDRPKLCNLEFAELCHMHANLIMLYKIFNGHICINLDNCICLSSGEHSTRGNRLKLHKFFAKLNIRKDFFAVRTVNLWNTLPDGIVACKMINNFVTKLKRAQLIKFLKGHACI